MSTEFFWRLPLGTDGPQLSTDQHNRGSFKQRPGHIAPGYRPDGQADGFTYIDYIAQVAKAAELAGFEGALLPTGPEPWIVAAALARETRRLRFLIAFQAAWTLPAYAAQQAAILQHLSHDRLDWNIITGGNPASQRAQGDFLDHDQRYRRTGEFLDIIDGLWRNEHFSYQGEVYQLDNGALPEHLGHVRKPGVYYSGFSDPALDVAARHADVYLNWAEPIEQLRPHIERVRELAYQVMEKVRADPDVINVNVDWDEPSKVVRLVVDQERARALGVSSAHLARFLQSSLSGLEVSTYREDNELIQILLRGPAEERAQLSLLGSLAVPTANGRAVPVSQVATLEHGFEEGIVWHRNRLPTVTVRADIYGAEQPASVVAQILPSLEDIRARLPTGYLLETGGTVEDSARGQKSIAAGMPLFLLAVTTLLMLQLRSFSRMALVLLTAPLGLIGVTLALLVFRVPFGFVAMLGTIALAGMIMRNSVILVDQIDQDIQAGHDRWHAIIDATVRRFRPIVLTALAAVLAMIPLSRSAFFGPMAVAIMGGLTVATVLTLFFLPALYAAWFKVKPEPDTGARG